MEQIRSSYDYLPVVAELRSNPDFEELVVKDENKISEEEKARILTTGPLAGSRGLPVQVCEMWSLLKGYFLFLFLG